ncbi:hypothetical protein LXL04_019928 [Taraxacum kok-saghyz]
METKTEGKKKQNRGYNGGTVIDKPRFSIDAHRLSVEDIGASSGGSAQSNSDTSTSNRESSSSSIKSSNTKTTLSVGDDIKSASNAHVSPANDVIFQGTKLVITENELKDWRLNSIRNSNIPSVNFRNLYWIGTGAILIMVC